MLKNKNFIVGAIAGAGVAGAALAGAGLSWPGANAQESPPAQVVRAQGPVVFAPPPGAPMSFADIIDRVSPAVVSIETRTAIDANALRRIPGFENFPFDIRPEGQDPDGQAPEGQGAPDGPGGQPGNPELDPQIGAGSGFFISADGYIVTNNHVVEGATEITVTLKDEREFKARVVGRDEATDLAVLKIDAGRVPYVEFENSATPRVGDWVIAVGNPFGLGGTATAGIVSAYGRNLNDQYVDFIQIDAPINRGNSGGPTFDIYGRVIGVNSAIYTPTGVSAGIGFAIPAEIADRVTKQLISSGRVSRGYLGVTIGAITEDIQKSLNLADRNGAYVTEIVAGGPAAQGGVEVGDIIVRMNGQTVKDNTDLTRRVAMVSAGQTIRLDVLRNGRLQTLQVRSGTRPTERELAARAGGGTDDGSGSGAPQALSGGTPFVGGLVIGQLDAAARQRFGIPATVNGVVITDVARGSAAQREGFRPGDVIIRADNQAVGSVAEAQGVTNRLRSAGRETVLLLITRDGRNAPAVVPLQQTPPQAAPTPPVNRPGSTAQPSKPDAGPPLIKKK